MHELWLCKNIFNIINTKMQNEPDKRVTKVVIEAGELLAIDQDSLKFSFKVLSKNTFADGAILEIVKIPGKATCDSCHKNVSYKNYADVCENCKQGNLKIIRGEELLVKYMEVK